MAEKAKLSDTYMNQRIEKYGRENKMTESEYSLDEILDEISGLMSSGPRANEFTIDMLMEKTPEVQRRTIHARLDRLCRRGILKSRMVTVDGHFCNAYSPASDGSWRSVIEELER